MTGKVLGLTEEINILGHKGEKILRARIDTGATKSSIDARLAADIQIGPVFETKLVKSAHGHTIRPIAHATVVLLSKKIKAEFTIADRTHMKYKVLIGQNILKKAGFLIDPCKK